MNKKIIESEKKFRIKFQRLFLIICKILILFAEINNDIIFHIQNSI